MNKKLIDKFLRHECNAQEELEILTWLKSTEHEELEEFIEVDLKEAFAKEKDTKIELCHILPKILDSEENDEAENEYPLDSYFRTNQYTEKNSKRVLHFVAKWAAAILLIAGFSFFFNYNLNKVDTVQSGRSNQYIVKENQRGRKSTIFLKDGSVVHLNSESKITYPEVFSDSLRIVNLEGEAFFEVAKNASKPFIVKAGPVDVKVLGTTFNVRSFSDTEQIKVSLVSGQVEVLNKIKSESRSENIILTPDQSVVYLRDKESFNEISSFNSDEDIGWKDGIIYFNKAGFIAVINKLESWYNVNFEIKNDPLTIWSYTGKFQNQNLENVLNSIGFSQEFTFEIEKEKIIIKFKTPKYDTNP